MGFIATNRDVNSLAIAVHFFRAEWVAEPFELNFHCLIQSVISPNFGGGLNYVTCTP